MIRTADFVSSFVVRHITPAQAFNSLLGSIRHIANQDYKLQFWVSNVAVPLHQQPIGSFPCVNFMTNPLTDRPSSASIGYFTSGNPTKSSSQHAEGVSCYKKPEFDKDLECILASENIPVALSKLEICRNTMSWKSKFSITPDGLATIRGKVCPVEVQRRMGGKEVDEVTNKLAKRGSVGSAPHEKDRKKAIIPDDSEYKPPTTGVKKLGRPKSIRSGLSTDKNTAPSMSVLSRPSSEQLVDRKRTIKDIKRMKAEKESILPVKEFIKDLNLAPDTNKAYQIQAQSLALQAPRVLFMQITGDVCRWRILTMKYSPEWFKNVCAHPDLAEVSSGNET